jgi:hypothetical protein
MTVTAKGNLQRALLVLLVIGTAGVLLLGIANSAQAVPVGAKQSTLATLPSSGVSAMTATASVASTPEGACGSGYSRQESHALSGAVVYLLYNGTYNCAVTIKTSSIGIPTKTTAGLQVTGSDWSYDTGTYGYYAGPVKLYGKGKCVRYFGYHGGVSYTSAWGHCG